MAATTSRRLVDGVPCRAHFGVHEVAHLEAHLFDLRREREVDH
jgi:hypothetical protein